MSKNLQPHPDRMTNEMIIFRTHELLVEHGLTDWDVRVNNRLRQTYGRCNYELQEIEISGKLAMINPADRTEETIRHEVAHALAPGAGHGAGWKRACAVVGAKPRRCFSEQDTNTIPRTYKVQGICGPCGNKVVANRQRMPRNTYYHSVGSCVDPKGARVTWIRVEG